MTESKHSEYHGKELEAMSFAINYHKWIVHELEPFLGHTVVEVGFKVEKARYFDLAGIIPWYVNFVLLKNSFSTGSITLYDRLVVPPMRLIEKVLVPPVGKSVLLVARKT